jgi:hypothetical protein
MKFASQQAGFTLAAGLALVIGFSAAGWANGAGFFGEPEGDGADVGAPYFGFVKDKDGNIIPDAMVTATLKKNMSVVFRTDIQGHYFIPGFNKDLQPSDIELTAAKSGYKQVAEMKRTASNDPTSPVEIDFTLAHD